MNAIRSTIRNLRYWIADIIEATKEAFAEMEAEKKNASPNLSNLLRDYMNLRKAERSEWSRYGRQKGTMDDLKAVSKALIYLKEHVSLKTGVTHNTRAGYKTVINILNKEAFGKLRIDKVRLSDAKAWLIKLQQVDGRGYSSIHSIRGVLRPAFQLAVDDDLIRKNRFGFELASVIVNDSVTREAITRKQERELLKFIKEDKHFCRYYDAIYILFHTGLRISEFCGLTISDIEFDQKRIKVDHQLQRTSQMQYVIQDPKTESGIRYVPMSEEVVACFRRILANRVAPKVEPTVDGYAGFLFLDKNDRPMVALHWEKYLQHIVEKYNKIYRIQMPKVTPHVCRHTFCSNMAKSGMNPKTLQYIMGHSDISVTLNVYTHVQFDDAQAELLRVAEA